LIKVEPDYWVHDLSPFLIRFTDGFGIRWYGIAYILGFAVAAWLLSLYYRAGRSPWTPDKQASVFWSLVVGVVAGGRVGYMLFYDFAQFVRDPLLVIRIWEGGMSSHGGFIGVAIALVWCARSSQTSFLKTADILVTVAPPGIFFGRIANFINGELWGKITDVPWAVIFPGSAPAHGTPVALIPPRHPSQLYEAGLEGLVLGVYAQLRFWLRDPGKSTDGAICGEFLVAYAALRITGELFREPDASGLISGLSRGVFYSLFVAAAGVGILLYAHLSRRSASLDR